MREKNHRYRVRIEDESYLVTIFDRSLGRWGIAAISFGLAAAMLVLAAALLMLTPLHTLLPGYMKEEQRSASEDNLLRLDSLRSVYEANQAYIDNFLRIYDTDRVPGDSAAVKALNVELTPDSLLPPSAAEKRFAGIMEERERYNISVLAPLAADGMMFSPVCDSGVFTAATKNEEQADILIPADGAVHAVADGSVLASYHSLADNGYVVLVQHPRGFASRYSSVGTPFVSAGDQVISGQVLAAPPPPDAGGKRMINLMIWHNGLPVIPFKYVGGESHDVEDTTFDAPRGK